MLGARIAHDIDDIRTIAQPVQLIERKKAHAGVVRFRSQDAIELDGMADGLVNLQAQLRRAENNSARAFGTLCGGMQRDSLLAGTLRVADKIKDMLVQGKGDPESLAALQKVAKALLDSLKRQVSSRN